MVRDPHDWVHQFVPFSRLHLVVLMVCSSVVCAWCLLGKRLMQVAVGREARVSRMVGWAIIVYQVWFLGRFFLPGHFTWTRSLPLMLCDLAALLAGAVLVWTRPGVVGRGGRDRGNDRGEKHRWMRTVLYFWAIGLSTQAFLTPILQEGYGTLRFWTFWIGHTAIVGTSIYDIVVRGYRPSWKDYRVGVAITLGYALVVIVLNLTLDGSGLLAPGEHANYGYLGNSTPKNPTLLDKLGAWPFRLILVTAIVLGLFASMTACWRLTSGRRGAGGAGRGDQNAPNAPAGST